MSAGSGIPVDALGQHLQVTEGGVKDALERVEVVLPRLAGPTTRASPSRTPCGLMSSSSPDLLDIFWFCWTLPRTLRLHIKRPMALCCCAWCAACCSLWLRRNCRAQRGGRGRRPGRRLGRRLNWRFGRRLGRRLGRRRLVLRYVV